MPRLRAGGGPHALGSLVLASSIALTPGCSYIFTSSGPPSRCSTSLAPPILDTLFGGFEVVRTGIAFSNSDEDYEGAPFSREVDILFGLGFTALFVASAYYGYSTTSECKQSQGSSIDEGGDYGRQQRTAPPPRPRTPPIRSTFQLTDWNVELLGVPEAEPNTVAVRVETRSASQRFKGCDKLETLTDGTVAMHAASYKGDVAGGAIREVILARVNVDALVALSRARSAGLGLCGARQELPPAALAQIGSFLQLFGSRGAPVAAPPPPPPPTELRIGLPLEGLSLELLGQPTLNPNHAFLLLHGQAQSATPCTAVTVTVDGATTTVPVSARPGGDPTLYAPLELHLVQGIGAAAQVELNVCGVARSLSASDRASVAGFAASFMQQRGGPAGPPVAPLGAEPGQPTPPGPQAPPAAPPTQAGPATAR